MQTRRASLRGQALPALPPRLAGEGRAGPRDPHRARCSPTDPSRSICARSSQALPCRTRLSFSDFGNSNLATKCPRVDIHRDAKYQTRTRTASVARDEGRSNRRADFVILFCRGRRLPCDQRNLFRSKRITCGWHSERQPKEATCVSRHMRRLVLTAASTSLEHAQAPVAQFCAIDLRPLGILLTIRHGACSSHRV
jgi:hypothetical protein